MPEYQIRITKTAQKQLDKLPDKFAENIISAIQALANNPRPSSCKNLKEEMVIAFAKETSGLFMISMINYWL
jgi:mRNA-degrading endonuclease RelE of RelBE toxin-antitoxin system